MCYFFEIHLCSWICLFLSILSKLWQSLTLVHPEMIFYDKTQDHILPDSRSLKDNDNSSCCCEQYMELWICTFDYWHLFLLSLSPFFCLLKCGMAPTGTADILQLFWQRRWKERNVEYWNLQSLASLANASFKLFVPFFKW